ncbi:hypothetical protein [Planobispora rosea]|uniref:hypothetical protein n=1 Tax=Planobispora rosea TaxID=35762 RepID=UPI0009FDDD82|nr:hypothetical protein [Planobispora rosea]
MNNQMAPAMPQLPAPSRVGQATAIEQSRAVAEVHAAIVVAQQCPRDVQAARLAMQDSCKQMGLAEKAFFRYSRGGGQVSGESIHLARELARCWGNMQYGIAELSRDDVHGQSEMMAFAWDVQTNSRSSTAFIVPHGRDAGGKIKPLTELRDIYENNANMGARRVREMILAILPAWYVEEAKELCNQTLAGGGGKPIPVLVDEALVGFAGIGVTADQMEQKIGRTKDQWNAYDLAQFRVIYRSIQRREVAVEDEFPPPLVTVAEVTAPAPKEPEVTVPGDVA